MTTAELLNKEIFPPLGNTDTAFIVSNTHPSGNVNVCTPSLISPGLFSAIVGPFKIENVSLPPLADVLSIDILLPAPAVVIDTAAKAELGAKKPPTINAAAISTKDDRKTFKAFSRERERERGLAQLVYFGDS